MVWHRTDGKTCKGVESAGLIFTGVANVHKNCPQITQYDIRILNRGEIVKKCSKGRYIPARPDTKSTCKEQCFVICAIIRNFQCPQGTMFHDLRHCLKIFYCLLSLAKTNLVVHFRTIRSPAFELDISSDALSPVRRLFIRMTSSRP